MIVRSLRTSCFDAIQKAAGNLEPGATMALEGFTLQLQRVNAKEDEMAGTDPTDNVYLNQIAVASGPRADQITGLGRKL